MNAYELVKSYDLHKMNPRSPVEVDRAKTLFITCVFH